MDLPSCTSLSPSSTSEAPTQSTLIHMSSSLSTAAAPPKDSLCNDNNTDVSGVTQEDSKYPILRKTVLINDKKHRRKKSEKPKKIKIIENGVPADDGYSWRKYGRKMYQQPPEFPRDYYKCVHRGCPAKKHVEMISKEPPCHKTVYASDPHTCKNPITSYHSIPPSRESCSSIVADVVDSAIDYSTVPREMSSLMSTYSDTTCDPSAITPPREEIPFLDSFDYLWDEERLNVTMADRNDCYSMFFLLPEDYEFEMHTLIQLWMARQCIRDEQTGQRIFSFLFDRGYTIHSGTDHVNKNNRYKVNSEKMKTLLDLQYHKRNSYLKWDNEFQNSENITNPSQVQHASLVSDEIDKTVFQTLEQLNELRTLLFLQNYGNKIVQIPDTFFQSIKKLQALDLSGTHINKLSSSVGCLILLRYLDLSRTMIEWLPDTICSLAELQTLKLRGCSKLRGLPRNLKKLTNLLHLDVDVLRQLTTVPRGIGSLVNLRTLSGFLVGEEDGCKIQELKELNSIAGDFCIAMLENVGNAEEAKEAAMFRKRNLSKLQYRWTDRDNKNCYEVLDCLQPWWNLKELQIFCYGGAAFPNWVGDPRFTELVRVTLFECEHVTELPLLEHLPWLKHLELVRMNGVKKIERRGDSENAAFSALEKLEIDGMQSLETWSWVNTNENDCRNLVELTISDCPELREFYFLSCLSSIKHLEIRECSKLESISEIKLPDSLKDLIVEDCPMIKHKCLQQGGEEWYKIQHVSNIRICNDDVEDDERDNI